MMKELLSLRFPLGSDILTTVRLATGGVCSLAGLNLDESEDCKVCVTESLLLLQHGGSRAARLAFYSDNGLKVEIASEEAGAPEPHAEDEISLALLSALVKNLAIERENGRLSCVKFRFGTK